MTSQIVKWGVGRGMGKRRVLASSLLRDCNVFKVIEGKLSPVKCKIFFLHPYVPLLHISTTLFCHPHPFHYHLNHPTGM
jgi:hypothetical protein